MVQSQKIRSGLRTFCAGFFFFTGIAWVRAIFLQHSYPLVRVLVIHHMRNPERLERMLRVLIAKYHVISFEDFCQKRFEKNKVNVLLTLDDGYASWYKEGLPLFQTYQIQPVGFIASGFLEHADLAVQQRFASKHLLLPSFDAPMHWEMVSAIQQSGWEIGGHTCTHPFLSTLDQTQVKQEIQEDKQTIEQRIGNSIRVFAYPFGDLRAHVVEEVKQAGYTYAFTTRSDFVRPENDAFLLPRSNHGTVHPLVLHMWVLGAFDLAFFVEQFVSSLFRRI